MSNKFVVIKLDKKKKNYNLSGLDRLMTKSNPIRIKKQLAQT